MKKCRLSADTSPRESRSEPAPREVDIDLERAVMDPAYRREVIGLLKAEAARKGEKARRSLARRRRPRSGPCPCPS